MVRKRSFPIVSGGGGVWSFVHMDDVTGATVAAVERGAPGVYNIVDDEPAQVAEWLPYLAETLGAKRPMRLPAWLVRPMLGEHGVSMMTAIRGSSNAKAKRELGWSLSYPSWRQGFRTGLGRSAAGGKKTLATSLILVVLLVACAPAADPIQTYPTALIAAVEKAAREKDFQALSDHMVHNFRFSFGRDPSRTKALSRYRTHPEILDKMANVLGQACALKTSGTETYYICPAAAADENKAYYDWRAGFRLKEDGTWEYVWFIAGD